MEALGFPDAEFFYGPGAPTTRTYDTRKIAGKVFGGANLIAITQGTGSAIVQVSSLAPSNPAAWQGVSGAAVFERAGASSASLWYLSSTTSNGPHDSLKS